MVILYVLLLLICCYKLKLRSSNNSGEFLQKQQTKSIQGIFTIIVLFSHFASYVSFDNVFDTSFVLITDKIGQLMVTMFLFYSGYGIVQSIKAKREEYVKGFFRNRILSVYARFFVSVVLFIIVDLCLGKIGTQYSIVDVLLSFTAWTSIGNSTWFMFATFALYIFVLISFNVFKKNELKTPIICVTALTVLYIIIFSLFLDKGVWWYNTILCFPLGMWVGYNYSKIISLQTNNKAYFIALATSILAFLGFWVLQDKIPFAYGYCLMALSFTAIVLLFTMKFSIGNKILDFFGSHVFSIYMLQRITYIIFEDVITSPYLFFVICFVLTIVIAVAFDYAFDKVYNKIKKRITT